MESCRIENVVTMVVTAAIVLGLYAMSHSFQALWGLILLFNLNAPPKK